MFSGCRGAHTGDREEEEGLQEELYQHNTGGADR